MNRPNEPATVAGFVSSGSGDASLPPEAIWLSEVVKGAVGKHHIGELITTVKRLMLVEALKRSSGNISLASELLGISRQGVQQMIQRTELRSWVRSLRRDGGDSGDSSGV